MLFLVIVVIFVIVAAAPLRGVMIKPGVSLVGLQPVMNVALAEGREVYREHSYEFWLTSGLEGKHGVGSLHFVGLAVDFRVRDPGPTGDGSDGKWNIPLAERRTMRNEIKAALGAQWDVVLKPNHIHVEFQPKVGTNA